MEFWIECLAMILMGVGFTTFFGTLIQAIIFWDTVVWSWYEDGAFGYKPKKKQ